MRVMTTETRDKGLSGGETLAFPQYMEGLEQCREGRGPFQTKR